MANEVPSAGPGEPSLASLVGGIVSDAQELISQQFRMLRAEVRSDFGKTKQALGPLVTGGVVTALGAVLLSLMLVFLLHWAVNPVDPAAPPVRLPLWACFGIVGGVFTTVGLILLSAAKKKFESFNPLPDETAEAVRETLQWQTNPR